MTTGKKIQKEIDTFEKWCKIRRHKIACFTGMGSCYRCCRKELSKKIVKLKE